MSECATKWKEVLVQRGVLEIGDGKRANKLARLLEKNRIRRLAHIKNAGDPWTWAGAQDLRVTEVEFLRKLGDSNPSVGVSSSVGAATVPSCAVNAAVDRVETCYIPL